MSADQTLQDIRNAKKHLRESAVSAGPRFSPNGSATSIWNDQVFEREITPSGEVECGTALRAGSTGQALYIALNASATNEAEMEIPKNSTITFTLLQADEEEGEFEEVGPTICMKAPADGMVIEPGDTICRVALNDMQKPWLKIKIEFSGAITGGTCIAGLGYAAR